LTKRPKLLLDELNFDKVAPSHNKFQLWFVSIEVWLTVYQFSQFVSSSPCFHSPYNIIISFSHSLPQKNIRVFSNLRLWWYPRWENFISFKGKKMLKPWFHNSSIFLKINPMHSKEKNFWKVKNGKYLLKFKNYLETASYRRRCFKRIRICTCYAM
jgi:hypothetical protein